MTGIDVVAARHRLGETTRQFAERLGLGKEGRRMIRRWEADRLAVPPHIAARIEAMEVL